ncbi:hypothetical protein SAMN06265337_4298 [Hymenobacter gelipurpurascens]|uniref:Uncharacterized protein n=1 Tax=Hymenobacter gelipurpurascens TaxID=89968 RepID=A0A212UHH2_9BACT|nr:hypothetical protein [Hymenobacter gelipurpurascens]SNC77697.1 hypothetical protein SAMN06265337_4298 [Hymenobacter gelipurpurascens]
MLTRIGTLSQLARRQEGLPNSPSLYRTRRSIDEEADLVIWLLEQHTADALAALQAPPSSSLA